MYYTLTTPEPRYIAIPSTVDVDIYEIRKLDVTIGDGDYYSCVVYWNMGYMKDGEFVVHGTDKATIVDVEGNTPIADILDGSTPGLSSGQHVVAGLYDLLESLGEIPVGSYV